MKRAKYRTGYNSEMSDVKLWSLTFDKPRGSLDNQENPAKKSPPIFMVWKGKSLTVKKQIRLMKSAKRKKKK